MQKGKVGLSWREETPQDSAWGGLDAGSPAAHVLKAGDEPLFSWQAVNSGTLFRNRIDTENTFQSVWNKISTEGI